MEGKSRAIQDLLVNIVVARIWQKSENENSENSWILRHEKIEVVLSINENYWRCMEISKGTRRMQLMSFLRQIICIYSVLFFHVPLFLYGNFQAHEK